MEMAESLVVLVQGDAAEEYLQVAPLQGEVRKV
jgi:hypothetical protein